LQTGFDAYDFVNTARKFPIDILGTPTNIQNDFVDRVREKFRVMIELFIQDMHRIIYNAPRGFPIVLYRGVDVDNGDFNATSKAFMSTSTDYFIAQTFMKHSACCLLTFDVSKDYPWLMLDIKSTDICVKKVIEEQDKLHFPHAMSLYHMQNLYSKGLNEQEVLILSNTPIEWDPSIKYRGRITTAMKEAAKREKLFEG
jgi:hypothetical protein